MRSILLIILLIMMFSCKKENNSADNNYNFHKAFTFRESKSYDSAFYYYNLAKNDFIETSDSIGTARSLINMAMIQTDNGDFLGGIESSLEANKFLNNKNDNTTRSLLGKNYNNLAIASNNLKNFKNSYAFYKVALKYVDDTEDKYVCYNNIGDVLITQGKIKLAKRYLETATLVRDSSKFSKALNNLAKAKYLDDPKYNPLPELNKALEIRKKLEDKTGLNSSYETLSTYFFDKNKSRSLLFAKKMFIVATENKSPDDQILALQRMISLDSQEYLENFERFNIINDSLQIARNQNKNQFAIVRYDVEQKNAQNQTLKAKNFRQNIGISFLALTLIGGVFYYKKRRKRLQQEKELEVKNTELRYSKKVHDKVANKVYHVMSEVENTPDMNKEVLLYKLDGIYQISRDISYEKNDAALEHNFSQHLSQMLKSYSSETIKVPIIGNEEYLWEDVPDNSKVEIFYILQELMTNMRKHSKADKVLLDFSRENDRIDISYSDNGQGITTLLPKNGLQNTESRINSIGGTINFDTETENGLKITLSFPVKN